MADHQLDARGLKCPQPTLKMTIKIMDLRPGDTLTVTADCPTFEKDVRSWADRTKNVLMFVRDDGKNKLAKVTKAS
ncbi:MAG: sulfurtransferase TusA family protein [Polyangiaceae bacterium]